MFACEANDEPALSQAIADQAIAESKNTLVNPDSEAKAMDSSSYSLTMDLSINETQLTNGNIVVETTVKKISKESIKLLSFNTPLDSSVLGRIFEVKVG